MTIVTDAGPGDVADPWASVAGQDRAVEQLRRAAERPGHAYLLVGARGSGVEEAARTFAATVVAPDGDLRSVELARRGAHPDVVEIDPSANQIRIQDAQAIVDEAYRSPVEGARKVILVFDAERLNPQASNKLLKTLEEPPPTAMIVLVTAGADQLLATIRSRCQRVDFDFLATRVVADALANEGISPERAEQLARLAGGRLDRARVLGSRLAAVRDAFVATATEVDRHGAAVSGHVTLVQEAIQASMAELEADQRAEADQLGKDLEAAGYNERARRARLRQLDEHQKRVHRHARTEALIEGITALESVYRDALAGDATTPINADHPLIRAGARAVAHTLDTCRAARQDLVEHNPNETLLLEHLILHLPSGEDAPGT